jgi:HlyD family secretion protein
MFRDTSAQDRLLQLPSRAWRGLRWGGLLVALALAATAVVGQRQTLFAARSISVSRLTLARVERGPFVRDITAEGKVVSANSPTLYAAQAGSLVLFDTARAGEAVSRGQPLGQIDNPELLARLAQESANSAALQSELQRARVEAEQQRSSARSLGLSAHVDLQAAHNELRRWAKAFEAGAAAEMQVEHARDALEKARIQAERADAEVALKEDSWRFELQTKQLAVSRQQLHVSDLERQRADLVIRSPVDGQIGQVFVAERATVARSEKLLSVVDLSELQVQLQVAESSARELALDMSGEMTSHNQRWRGVISSISPEVVNNEVAARLRFEGETPLELRRNQRLLVRVLLERRDQVLSVRRGSFADEGGGAYAYVVRGSFAHKVPVQLGTRSIDRIEVLSGLGPGEQVVVSGVSAFAGASEVLLSQ